MQVSSQRVYFIFSGENTQKLVPGVGFIWKLLPSLVIGKSQASL
jgi:hypothetical protein